MTSKLISVFKGEDLGYTPVWLMRQAGRYLPEYLELKARHPNFWDRCKNPELAAEITLQPLKRYPLDAAILFADILTIPDLCGHPVEFVPQQGPIIESPIRSSADIAKLPPVETVDGLEYVYTTLRLLSQELSSTDTTLIGFAGSPWTVATYMLEGKKSPNHFNSLHMLYTQPEVVYALVDRLTEYTIRYLDNQVKAGAQMLQLFDTWGGILPADAYTRLSLEPLNKIVNTLSTAHPNVPMIFFGKGVGHRLNAMNHAMQAHPTKGLSLDWTVDLAQARQTIPGPTVLQGNLDPKLLRTSPAAITQAVQQLFKAHPSRHYFIANLGHGIMPEAKPELVGHLIEQIHLQSQIIA